MLLAESTRLLSRGHRLIDSEIRSASRTLTSNEHRWYYFLSICTRHSDSHPFNGSELTNIHHAMKRSNSTTNSLLPSLSSILKRRRRYHALSAGGYFSSTYSNRETLRAKYDINDYSSKIPALNDAQSGMTSLLFGDQYNRRSRTSRPHDCSLT